MHMKRGKFYLCAVLFLALTAVKMISPAAAADVRSFLVPAISEDVDYRVVLASVQTALRQPDENVRSSEAPLYSVMAPLDRLQMELEQLRADPFADLPQVELPEPEPEAEPEEPEISPEMQAAQAARATFLDAQAAFSDYAVPANVSYDIPELPFAYASPVASYTSSGFGYRVHPIESGVKFHYGTDFAVNSGTDICAFADGTVLAAGWDAGYGNYVKLDHGGGYVTLYGHCSELLVRAGQTVQCGDRIALAGATGQATGPHLHLELIHSGVYLNPEFYLTGV